MSTQNNESEKAEQTTSAPLEEEISIVASDEVETAEISEEEASNLDPSFMDRARASWKTTAEKKKKTIQIIAGIILGSISSIFLFVSSGDTAHSSKFISWPILIALGVALIIPNIIEKQLEAKLMILRTTLLITLAAALITAVIIYAIQGKF